MTADAERPGSAEHPAGPALFWLSFADPKRPKGERFLGVALVEAEGGGDGRAWVAAALKAAWRAGCNPGGEVEVHRLRLDELANRQRVRLARAPRNTLLSEDDLHHYDLI